MKRRRRDLGIAGLIFVVLAVLGLAWAANSELQPEGASREAEIVDGAFDLLLYMAIPVYAFVAAVLVYALLRFRARGDESDAEPIRTDARFVWSWVVISSALAIFSIFNPGLKGLSELRAEPNADLNVKVTGEQWNWTFEYEELGITVVDANELALPVDTRVAFHITSIDVLHSFWIPALRIKADAVPGSVATILTTPTHVGEFEGDPTLRVQCAEICGTGHSRMRASVRVMDADEFAAWAEAMGGVSQ